MQTCTLMLFTSAVRDLTNGLEECNIFGKYPRLFSCWQLGKLRSTYKATVGNCLGSRTKTGSPIPGNAHTSFCCAQSCTVYLVCLICTNTKAQNWHTDSSFIECCLPVFLGQQSLRVHLLSLMQLSTVSQICERNLMIYCGLHYHSVTVRAGETQQAVNNCWQLGLGLLSCKTDIFLFFKFFYGSRQHFYFRAVFVL